MYSLFNSDSLLRSRRFRLLLVLTSLSLTLVASGAQAQSFLTDVGEPYTQVAEQLNTGDPEAAERTLNALASHSNNGDYHYLRGVLAMESMNDAGALQMARLARRMRSHFEDALQAEPDHALAHFGLMQFHRFAPGIMGGRKRDLEFHQQRLIELDSFLQFPAALIKAQQEADQEAQKGIYEAWIAHSPTMFDAHYSYLTSLISWADYEQARSAIEQALAYADETQTQLVEYQQVRMAALFAMARYETEVEPIVDEATDSQTTPQEWRSLSWLTQAHATGLALLASEQRSTQIDDTWLQMRLAQVEWALHDTSSALARIELVRHSEADERLLAEADSLAAKIN